MRLRRGTEVLLNLFLNAFNFFNKHTLVNYVHNLSKCKTESIRFNMTIFAVGRLQFIMKNTKIMSPYKDKTVF